MDISQFNATARVAISVKKTDTHNHEGHSQCRTKTVSFLVGRWDTDFFAGLYLRILELTPHKTLCG